ncbi:MAG: TonB-dependent receptor, partial [bacterium]|nr:TonB-dependent receptor [bacterium]
IVPGNPGLIPASDYTQIGLYAQDTWRATDKLSIYYGLRYDRDDGVFDTLTQGINRTFYEAVAAGSPGRFENTFPEDTESFAPRGGFVYSLGDSDKNVIRGSFGQFNDKVIENLTIFGTQNLSPVVFPNLPTLTCSAGTCAAGSDPDGPGGVGPLPVDFTWNNWLQQGELRDWYETLVSSLGPLSNLNGQLMLMPAPDGKTPVINTVSVGWGHR